MAHCPADCPSEADRAGDRGVPKRCRGRPRLTDSDRAQRRLESRKKYDVRRVYLGESHKLWSELRRRTSLSDAGLAEYLILLNSTYGDKNHQESCGKKTTAGVTGKQKGGVCCLCLSGNIFRLVSRFYFGIVVPPYVRLFCHIPSTDCT
ncbi:zinc finger protein 653-like [Poecilia formosa]|uniref:zinc finger protein 653-like n=1 Tax=Poecilia formosa TaxID=48698 RepID=UPI0007B7F6A4|nr:PREDICTED: zinc finger protein 653-like [Poecilia formosa]